MKLKLSLGVSVFLNCLLMLFFLAACAEIIRIKESKMAEFLGAIGKCTHDKN